MKNWIAIVVIGSLGILVFDTLASLLAVRLGMDYSIFALGSFLIYVAIGFVVAKFEGIGFSIIAAVLVSVVESTIGWYISWILGPGRIENGITWEIVLFTIVLVWVLASICGLVGGLIGRLVFRQSRDKLGR